MVLETLVTDSLWVAQIPLRTYGLEIGTRMTVCRLSGGDLWIHSPINPDKELRQQLLYFCRFCPRYPSKNTQESGKVGWLSKLSDAPMIE